MQYQQANQECPARAVIDRPPRFAQPHACCAVIMMQSSRACIALSSAVHDWASHTGALEQRANWGQRATGAVSSHPPGEPFFEQQPPAWGTAAGGMPPH